MRYPSMYTQPQGIVMWGGGGAAGPKMAPGVYTVKVTSGSWTESQTFRLKTDPRLLPVMTDAEGAEQLRLAREIGEQYQRALHEPAEDPRRETASGRDGEDLGIRLPRGSGDEDADRSADGRRE